MKRSGFQVMSRLIGLVKPLTGYMCLAIVMGFLGHLSAALIPVIGAYLILRIMQLSSLVDFGPFFALLLTFSVLRGLLRYGEQTCNHFIAFKLLALIRDKVFGALRRLAPAKLDSKEKGNLISIITSDIELLEVFYAHTISPIAIAILFSSVVTLFIGRLHPALGLLACIAFLTIGALLPYLTSKWSGNLGMRLRNQSGNLSSFVLESLRGLSALMQFNLGKKRLDEMNRMAERLSGDAEKMKQQVAHNMAITNTLIFLFDLAMLFLSAVLVSPAESVLATIALMSSFGPVVSLAALGATLQHTFAAGNRVLDLLDETPVVAEISGFPDVAFEGATASNVSFSYEGAPVLKAVSLDLPAHRIIGVHGPSGSGKSTFLKLLMHFWKVDQGEIRISDRNIEEINTPNLREMESLVAQETHLFHDSIRNNLRIAKRDATDAEIIAACKKASIHDFILTLPNGYDTEVGELGDTLSGGERQRLGLARAFLHDAPLMLLDEPTSNLDSLNEAVILKSLHEEQEEKTILLVSHRKSTLGIADVIASVENGHMRPEDGSLA